MDAQRVPTIGVGAPGLGRAGCGADPQEMGDTVTSPALHPRRASSSGRHGPRTTWHFQFPSSHLVEKLQPRQLFGEKEG